MAELSDDALEQYMQSGRCLMKLKVEVYGPEQW